MRWERAWHTDHKYANLTLDDPAFDGAVWQPEFCGVAQRDEAAQLSHYHRLRPGRIGDKSSLRSIQSISSKSRQVFVGAA